MTHQSFEYYPDAPRPTPPPGPDGVPTATEYVTQLQGERPPTIEERVQTNLDLERVQLARRQAAEGVPSAVAGELAWHLADLIGGRRPQGSPGLPEPIDGVPAFRITYGGRQLLVHVMEVGN